MTPALSALGIYVGLLTLVGFWLLYNVSKRKSAVGVSIGDGGDTSVIRAQRGQMNFVENVPMAIFILLIAALTGTPAWLIHIAGAALVIARILHARHFTQDDAPGWQRAAGMMLTSIVLVFGSAGLIFNGIYTLL